MLKFAVWLCVLWIYLPVCSADQLIRLKDGSEIRGEVVSLANGTYTIKTGSLGTISLGSHQVEAITGSGGAQPPADIGGAGASAVQSIQSSILSDTGLMSSIMRLQSDPAMRAVLSDPEVMKAVQNMDLQSLAENPKIKALMNSREMKSITEQMR